MVNIATKSLFYVIRYFFMSKNMKKRYMEMIEKFYFET